MKNREREWEEGTAFRFAVLRDGMLIGCVDIDNIKGEEGSFGYWLDEAFWGRGFATEAGSVVRDVAFGVCRLRTLVAGRNLDNPASGRVLEKLGFRETGTASIWSNSRQCDVVQMRYELKSNVEHLQP